MEELSHRTMLRVQGIRRNGNPPAMNSVGEASDVVLFDKMAVNDLVLDIGPPFRTGRYEIWINGCKLQTISGDGVIIATPTGSTAYTLSSGGPIVQPELPGFSITPKNVHRLSIRPIVVRNDQEITIKVLHTEGIWAIIDGQFTWQLREKWDDDLTMPCEMVVSRHPSELCLINNPDVSYWSGVTGKLGWGK